MSSPPITIGGSVEASRARASLPSRSTVSPPITIGGSVEARHRGANDHRAQATLRRSPSAAPLKQRPRPESAPRELLSADHHRRLR